MNFYGNYQVYSDTGVDLTLLRENLNRTPEERLAHNAKIVKFVDALRESGRAGSSLPSKTWERGVMADFDAPAILTQLTSCQVEFVLIGGLAMIAHGSAYVTKDLDICYARSEKNLTALVTALAPLHPYLRGAPPGLPFHLDLPTLQAGLNFTLTTERGDLDLLGEVSGLGRFENVVAVSEDRVLYGLSIRILSLEGLIAAKKAAGRIKDRNHILELEELKKMRDAQP
jgi:hypothetical protein